MALSVAAVAPDALEATPGFCDLGSPLTLEKAVAGPWDAPVKGSSALRAAILGMLQDEVAVYRGRNTFTTLWDEEKFHDNIDILQLINKSKEVE